MTFLHSFQFLFGLLLLVFNVPIGLGGLALGAYLADKTGRKIYYAFGSIVYVLSWGMLLAGGLLAGRRGLRIVRDYFGIEEIGLLIGILILVLGIVLYVRSLQKKDEEADLAG